jgi:hypothetical protein
VRSRHTRLKHALFAAIPLEAINFWIIGYPAGTHSISRASQNAAVALQWYLLHLPGIIATDRSIYLQHHAILSSTVLFLAGLIDTALLVLLLLWLTGLAHRALRKLSSPHEASRLSSH